MVKRMSIALSSETGEKLRTLANRLDMTITDLIADLVDVKLQELAEIEPVGGWLCQPVEINGRNLLLIGSNDLPTVALNQSEVNALCEAICACADRNETTVLSKTTIGKRLIEVRRQGRGVVLSIDG